jgi:hypothetical protein
MDQRISLVTLGVNDLERSKIFYESLGWKRSVLEASGVVFFQMGGMALSLFPLESLAADAKLSAVRSGFTGFTLAQNVRSREDVDAVLKEAIEKGATLVKPAEEAFWGGYSGYFSDPDGFLWEIAWNPGFPTDADGNIKLPD